VCLNAIAIDNRFLHQLAQIKNVQAFSLKQDNGLLYVRNQNQIWVYSIFNAWQPKLETGFLSPFPIEDFATHSGNYLYVASREPTNQIIQVDSLSMSSKIFFTYPVTGDKLTREGSTLYVADRFRGIDIVNIGGGSIREIISTFSEKWGIRDFQAAYPYIFALNDFGLVAVDITDQTNPHSIATNYQLTDATCLVKNANTLWIGAGKNLYAFNIFDPENPKLISQLRMANEILNLKVKDNRLYVALGRGGVKIIDVTNPLKTEDLNNILLNVPVYELALVDDYIFLALGKEGWVVYEYR
jgi:hypothetical protein